MFHIPPRRSRIAALVATTALLCACGSPERARPTAVKPATTTTAETPPTTNPATTTPASTTPAAVPRATVPVTVSVPAGNGAAPFDVPRTLLAPAGTGVEAWARVPGARFEVWTPSGDLLVSVPGSGTIVRLHPAAQPADPPTVTTVVSGLASPQGMAFDRVDGTEILYVAEDDQIDRYAWAGTGVGARSVLATLPGPESISGYVHPLKEVVVGPDHTVYVNIGSTGNIAAGDRTATPPRAVIESFPPSGAEGTLVAVGVRNGEGLSCAPDGALWAAVNERDNIADPATGRVDQTYVNDHPPDELAAVSGGRDLGWPYCDPVVGGGSDPYGAMVLEPDVQTNPGAIHLDCSTLAPIERGIPAHSAPLGLSFLQGSALPAVWRDGAVLGTHGSNDHVPPTPGAVLWLPWQGRTLGAAQDLLSGFITGGGDRWGRPVDPVPGPDGALYVSDDTAGAIYRVTLPSGAA